MLTLTGRIGCFFLILGAGILVVYLISDQAHAPQFAYLFLGLLLSLVGFGFWRKGRQPPRESSRFRVLRGRSARGGDGGDSQGFH